MKPLLVIPPAPARWRSVRDLYAHKPPPWLADMEQRFVPGVAGADDAYTFIILGGQLLAGACINKHGPVGVLGHVYTRPEQRRRGLARRVLEALLAWFDMRGGRWLYLSTTAELDESVYRKFGFSPLRRAAWEPADRLTMLRTSGGVTGGPLDGVAGDVEVRDLTRADWPALVALLQYRGGPDPRVPLAESAVTAELFGLDLVTHQEQGRVILKGALQGGRLTSAATLALDRPTPATYALAIPSRGEPAELRTALLAAAAQRGYKEVGFPMETLASGAPVPPTAGIEATPHVPASDDVSAPPPAAT